MPFLLEGAALHFAFQWLHLKVGNGFRQTMMTH